MMNGERASATGDLQPNEFQEAYDRAVQIRELFSALNALGSFTDESFAFSTLANKGSELANQIVNELRQMR